MNRRREQNYLVRGNPNYKHYNCSTWARCTSAPGAGTHLLDCATASQKLNDTDRTARLLGIPRTPQHEYWSGPPTLRPPTRVPVTSEPVASGSVPALARTAAMRSDDVQL
eukprot:2585705-Rhodomonas_salina.1